MASGVAEHGEARRRERGYLKKAFLQKQTDQVGRSNKVLQNEAELAAGHRLDRGAPNSYDMEVKRLENMGIPRKESAAQTVDRQRRSAHYKQMQSEYSAKLPHRYNSIDYVSQW